MHFITSQCIFILLLRIFQLQSIFCAKTGRIKNIPRRRQDFLIFALCSTQTTEAVTTQHSQQECLLPPARIHTLQLQPVWVLLKVRVTAVPTSRLPTKWNVLWRVYPILPMNLRLKIFLLRCSIKRQATARVLSTAWVTLFIQNPTRER